MRGIDLRCTFEYGGKLRDDVVLTCVSGGQSERWSVDVPSVLWMLDRIAAGDADVRSVEEDLRQAVRAESGCCSDCDRAAPHYESARRRYEALLSDCTKAADSNTCSYVLNRSRIHRATCGRVPKPKAAASMAGLHSFAGLFDAYGGDLGGMLQALESEILGGTRWISMQVVLDKIAREGGAAVRARLCRSCKPDLPELDSAAESLQPACWRWAAGPAVLREFERAATLAPSENAAVLAEHRASFGLLERWQAGRCAVCGEVPARGVLVRDHDHDSGLIRGLLCLGCNTLEGRSTSLLFERYRQRPPAAVLGIKVLFLPIGFRPGVGHAASMGVSS